MNSDMIQRIEAFEMWVWRRMEKESWTERKTNDGGKETVDKKNY